MQSLLLAVSLITVIADAPAHAAVGKPFDVGVGKAAVGGEWTVQVMAVVDDSRCALDTTCFWEGDAVVRVAVSRKKTRLLLAELHTNRKFPNEARFGTHRIRLITVAPLRRSSEAIAPKTYTITLIVVSD